MLNRLVNWFGTVAIPGSVGGVGGNCKCCGCAPVSPSSIQDR